MWPTDVYKRQPFHVYDEKGIRENVRRINKAFSWNKGFKEYFAVKALPNPVILQILKEEGCGVDCSSLTELMLSEACGFTGHEIMFSSNQTPVEDMQKAYELGAYINLDDATMVEFLELSLIHISSVQNCLTAPAMTGPRHTTGSSSFSTSRLMLITSMPMRLWMGQQPLSSAMARP